MHMLPVEKFQELIITTSSETLSLLQTRLHKFTRLKVYKKMSLRPEERTLLFQQHISKCYHIN